MGLKQLFGLTRPREALLLPDYAWLYPEVPPGVWIRARNVADRIRREVARGRHPWPTPGPRLLADEHFRFRDGQHALGRWLGGRRGDSRSRGATH
jgi:hypothetical protein